MNAQGQDKLLSAIDNPSVGYVPGGFDGRTFSADYYDDDFRRFKMKSIKTPQSRFSLAGTRNLVTNPKTKKIEPNTKRKYQTLLIQQPD